MNNYNYPFPQNGNNNQNTWQNNGQNWNNIQDNGMYGLPRQPMNYQQMRGMMNQQMQPMQQSSKVDRVNGKEGAEAYFLMPNSEILLLDTTNHVVWHKQTDSVGYGTVTGFKITPLEDNLNKEQYDYYALEQRIRVLEEILEGMTYDQPEQQNVQPAATNIQQPNAGSFKSKQHNTK